jgi:glycosyltransferase involved in cell wall biosynthesis
MSKSSNQMRFLVLAGTSPWPSVSGVRLRLANIIRALSEIGDVDVFVSPPSDPKDVPELPPWVKRYLISPSPRMTGRRLRRASLRMFGRLPSRVASRSYEEAQTQLSVFASDEYSYAWYESPEMYSAFHRIVDAPALVDLDDLEDQAAKLELGLRPFEQGGRSGGLLRRLESRALKQRDMRRWSALQQEIVRTVELVAICSEEDRGYLGAGNAVLIPNGYERPPVPLGRRQLGNPPTILLQGSFVYGPNIDGAEYLVHAVLPLIRQRIADVQVRLVGRAGPTVRALADPPHVVVTDLVPDMAPELARADLVCVPIRYAGGTRVKILEAFAHRIPVVSTAVGAWGLQAVPDQDLLVANDAQGLADACVAALSDELLRARIVDSAERHFLNHYESGAIREAIKHAFIDFARVPSQLQGKNGSLSAQGTASFRTTPPSSQS